MLTIEQMNTHSELHGLRKNLVKQSYTIMMDFRLIDAMTNDVMEHNQKRYDTDVYLEKYGINLQRPYVWTYTQQNAFIQSILYNKTIPPFVIIQYEVTKELLGHQIIYVIDGKQRLITVQKFVHNEFPVEIGGEKYFYKDFDDKLKLYFSRQIDNFEAMVYYSYPDNPITDDEKILIFNFYNFTGTPQAEEHKLKLQSLIK